MHLLRTAHRKRVSTHLTKRGSVRSVIHFNAVLNNMSTTFLRMSFLLQMFNTKVLSRMSQQKQTQD